MDYIAILERDLERGFSKSDLERLIGLPQNNLSGILKKNRKLSRKSELKIEKWEASEKPNPLDLKYDNNIKDLASGNVSDSDIEKLRKTSIEFTDKQHTESKIKALSSLSDYEIRVAKERIEVLKKEIANPPQTKYIPITKYIAVRQQELNELLNKLK